MRGPCFGCSSLSFQPNDDIPGRNAAPIYGSGGFTTYSNDRLKEQLAAWVERNGCRFVKMKIGSDPERAFVAKSAVGEHQLFVDANGAFSVKQALQFVAASGDADIRWFEEPVTSDDPLGLRLMRERTPPGMDVAAGEEVYDLDDARGARTSGGYCYRGRFQSDGP